ncbi:MAG: PKD domain-containing protein, partial [Planctomycetota bacterium]
MNKSLLIGILFSLASYFMPQQLYACPTTPTAKIVTPDPDETHYVCLGDSVSFDGEGSDSETPPTGSYDGDNGTPNGGGNGISAYDWTFGDGETGTGGTTSHTYTEAEEYTVSLKVTDDDDPSQTDTTDSSGSVKICVIKVEIYSPAPSDFPKYIGIDSSLTLQAKVTPSSATGGTFTWSKVSGLGAVTFTPSGGSTTSFSSSTVGSYTVMVQYTKGGVTCDSDSSGTIEVCDAKMIFEAGEPPAETDSLT